jgi:hypothetical protein
MSLFLNSALSRTVTTSDDNILQIKIVKTRVTSGRKKTLHDYIKMEGSPTKCRSHKRRMDKTSNDKTLKDKTPNGTKRRMEKTLNGTKRRMELTSNGTKGQMGQNIEWKKH